MPILNRSSHSYTHTARPRPACAASAGGQKGTGTSPEKCRTEIRIGTRVGRSIEIKNGENRLGSRIGSRKEDGVGHYCSNVCSRRWLPSKIGQGIRTHANHIYTTMTYISIKKSPIKQRVIGTHIDRSLSVTLLCLRLGRVLAGGMGKRAMDGLNHLDQKATP